MAKSPAVLIIAEPPNRFNDGVFIVTVVPLSELVL
jgi:hypothetical protein